jgi:heme-degrading monooxygenase HmoA
VARVVARLIRFEGVTEGVEGRQARAYRELLPAFEEMAGFRGLILLGAPEREEAALISLWSDDEAANQSAEAARALRERTADAGEVPLSIERFEVMLFEV